MAKSLSPSLALVAVWFALAHCLALPGSMLAIPSLIKPGDIWPDNRGQHIQAHGGGIIKVGNTWYWYGEDRGKENERGKRYVACYSSNDLVHWTFRNQVIAQVGPDEVGPRWVLERPKVFYNERTRKYVMWMHIDGPSNPQETDPRRSNYALARVGIAVCDTPDGTFKYVRSFRPLGQESRDIGQFIDDDGSAYLIFEARPTHGFFIAKLTDDYMDVKEQTAFIKAPLEGGALVHYQGLYYVVASAMTGWDPNPNKYATAPSLKGPWSEFKDIAPPGKRTYGSQSTLLLKVAGSRTTSVLFMGDEWRPSKQWDSRYLWMPLKIGDGKLWLPEPKPWALDAQTGEALMDYQPSALDSLKPSTFTAPTSTPASEMPSAPAPAPLVPVTPEQFTTAAEAQKEAVRRYPDLGIAGSRLNAAFVARCKLYQQQKPDFFKNPSWPLRLIEEIAPDASSLGVTKEGRGAE